MLRATTSRWISDVPSKIVSLTVLRATSAHKSGEQAQLRSPVRAIRRVTDAVGMD